MIWKDVVGFENYFKISNHGDIYSYRSARVLKRVKDKSGYLTLPTKIGGREGKDYCFKIHRLVAIAFIPNPKGKPCVNHKDGDKENNHISNLEWCTVKENTQHAFDTGLSKALKGEKNVGSRISQVDADTIRLVYTPYCRTYGARALGRRFGISHSNILKVINGISY
jgi:hypothetical protein